MIEVVSEIGAHGWYGEVWLRIGFQKRLVHQTVDTYQDADQAEEAAATWAMDAMGQFFEFYIAQSAEEAEHEQLDTADLNSLSNKELAEYALGLGVDVSNARNKTQLIDAIQAAHQAA